MKKLIAILMLLAVPCIAQQRVVFCDGTNLYTYLGTGTTNSFTNSPQLTFNNQIKINSTNTSVVTDYGIMANGVHLYGVSGADKWVTFGPNATNPVWAIGTYRNENDAYLYHYNTASELPMLVMSTGGRIGFNHPDNIVDYHSYFIGTGVDDANWGGINTAKQTYRFNAYITSTGVAPAADQWTWKMSADMGATWFFQAPVTNYCTTNAIALTNGVTLAFYATNGHTLADGWLKTAWSQLPVASMEVRPRRFQECLLGTNWWSSTASFDSDVSYDFGTGIASHDVLTTTNACILLGSKSPVNAIFFNVLNPGAGLTLVLEYWNGSAWVPFTQSAQTWIDKTANFTTYGEMTMEIGGISQVKKVPNGKDASEYNLYWYQVRTTTTPTTTATLSAVTPHGEKRFAVYPGMLSPQPCFWIGGRGNTYVQRAYMEDTNSAFSDYQLVTEARVQQLLKNLGLGIYWYPQTNYVSIGSFTSAMARVMALTPSASEFRLTNAVAANSVTTGNLFVATNTWASTTLTAGTKYTMQVETLSSGNAGYASTMTFQLIDWIPGHTNVLGTSDVSKDILNNASTFNSINVAFTVLTNTTVAATNYPAVWPVLTTTGNKAGTWVRKYGGQANSYFIIGK